MVFPLVPSPLGGNLGARTCSIFRLDPLGVVPLEPLIDIIPGLTPLRVTLDMVDQESTTYNYTVTENPVQAGDLDIATNVHKQLERITITGSVAAVPPLVEFPPAPIPTPPGLGGAPFIPQPPVPGSFLRLDLIRVRNLVSIADARALVMVVTPRVGLARAFIENITPNWSPALGEQTTVSITFKEARFVDPLFGDAVANDFPSQNPGNNAVDGGGQSQTSNVNELATPNPSGTPEGIPPSVGQGGLAPA